MAPVGSALLSSVRSRDPRIARQQQNNNQTNQLNIPASAPQNQINTDSQTTNKPIQLTSISSSYSDINNVMPGKIINQVNKNMLPKIPKLSRQQPSVDKQNNTLNPRPTSPSKKSFSHNSNKSSPTKTTSSSIALKSRSNRHGSSKSSSSSTSTKSKSDRSRDDKKRSRKRSASPSSRHNYDKSPKRNSDESNAKRTTLSSSPPESSQSTKFKELKKSSRDRNNIRKNRSETISPTPQTIIAPKDEKRSLSQPRDMKVIEAPLVSPRKSEPKEITNDTIPMIIDKRKNFFFIVREIVHIFKIKCKWFSLEALIGKS